MTRANIMADIPLFCFKITTQTLQDHHPDASQSKAVRSSPRRGIGMARYRHRRWPRYTEGMDRGPDLVAVLRRWEEAGGLWRVLGQNREAITLGLYRCDDGEEIDRFVATDPRVEQFLAGRTSSQETPVPGPPAGAEAAMPGGRDRDASGRARQARPRDRLGRPLPYGSVGVEPVPEEPLPPLATISAAHDLLAAGRPFAAHEVYEARWKAGPDAERELWQGLAQLCVGITHAERGNRIGALRLIGRARHRLEVYAATGGPDYGLDLGSIIEWVRKRELARDDRSWLIGHPL
jgi:uncharacterized protein